MYSDNETRVFLIRFAVVKEIIRIIITVLLLAEWLNYANLNLYKNT